LSVDVRIDRPEPAVRVDVEDRDAGRCRLSSLRRDEWARRRGKRRDAHARCEETASHCATAPVYRVFNRNTVTECAGNSCVNVVPAS
jgi:hypothetical protein